jgi:hypothetical protein
VSSLWFDQNVNGMSLLSLKNCSLQYMKWLKTILAQHINQHTSSIYKTYSTSKTMKMFIEFQHKFLKPYSCTSASTNITLNAHIAHTVQLSPEEPTQMQKQCINAFVQVSTTSKSKCTMTRPQDRPEILPWGY